jgi:hypothetical protein
MEPRRKEPCREEPQAAKPRREEKRKRFRLVKLEERITLRHNYHGSYSGYLNCGSGTASIE